MAWSLEVGSAGLLNIAVGDGHYNYAKKGSTIMAGSIATLGVDNKNIEHNICPKLAAAATGKWAHHFRNLTNCVVIPFGHGNSYIHLIGDYDFRSRKEFPVGRYMFYNAYPAKTRPTMSSIGVNQNRYPSGTHFVDSNLGGFIVMPTNESNFKAYFFHQGIYGEEDQRLIPDNGYNKITSENTDAIPVTNPLEVWNFLQTYTAYGIYDCVSVDYKSANPTTLNGKWYKDAVSYLTTATKNYKLAIRNTDGYEKGTEIYNKISSIIGKLKD